MGTRGFKERNTEMVKMQDFEALRVKPGQKVRLKNIDAGSSGHVPSRETAEERTEKCIVKLGDLQDMLYAECRQSLLVVLQGLDASGKDGTVRKVFDAVNPTGVQVTSFKQPSAEELRHDFLWRCHAKAPARGYIGVFNRSYYEDVLVVRVHAERLLAPELRGDKGEWKRRFRMISDFEKTMGDAGTRIVKLFLHISKEEQRKRFESRQKDMTKNWKLSAGDFEERKFWNDYQRAYEKMLPATSTEGSPWYIVPADHNWIRNYFVSHILVGVLERMDPKMPKIADRSLIHEKFK